MTMVRTRFAPSPTGFLHIGGVRTAFFAWLFARSAQGEFILRIEDTDRERSTEESVQAIINGMAWLGLDYDEGPYYQTERMGRYQAAIERLVNEGHAYRCYCDKTRIEALREAQMAAGEKPRYDGHCRELGSNQAGSFVIRFKNPQSGSVTFDDQVRGRITIQNSELDDLIIARSDATPTYNLCVVVDDSEMQITHVVRGDDHINNTPRQINIFKALEKPVPIYAHVPTILGEDGKRLSKRYGAANVLSYREAGFLPEALLNYLVRLGWSHGDQEIFSLEEMITLFRADAINGAPAALNAEKLLWLNHHYIKTLAPELIAKRLHAFYEKDLDLTQGPDLKDVVIALRERAKNLKEMAEKSLFWFVEPEAYEEKAAGKFFKASAIKILEVASERLEAVAWEKEAIHGELSACVETLGVGFGKLAQPVRLAVTGTTISPPLDVTLSLLGREKSIARIDQAIEWIKDQFVNE